MLRRAVPLAAAASIAGLATLMEPGAARADEAPSVAAATLLFDEGVKLMDSGRAAEACPKLARSQALAPSGGTLLALGECYEKTGRVASAWLAFREAATRAAGAGKRDAELSSLERAKRLEPRLPRLVITVPPATRVPGLEIKRDGATVKDAELGVAVPFDPGAYDIEATAPRRQPFKSRVTLRLGETTDLPIPKLAPETVGAANDGAANDGVTPPPITEPPDAAPSSDGSSQRVVGLVIAGVGVASLIGGGAFGLIAKSKNDEALESQNCPTSTRCNTSGLELTDDARSSALVSTILFVVGGAAVVGGGIVFLTAPRRSATAGASPTKRGLYVRPDVGLRSAGAAATLVW